MTLAAIPSPTVAVWYAGPIPIRAYALFIVLGIVVACVVTEYRLRARGVHRFAVLDIAVWAVPFGIVGGRIYHVITSPHNYFGADGDPVRALYVWEGGLGIWGAIAGGALGVWLGCRQMRLPFLLVADAAAVGIPLAQAVGRLGNWFNNELYGSQTTLPWGLEVHRMQDFRAAVGPDGEPIRYEGLYHPTFLYEMLWCVGVALLVLFLSRQLRLGRGRAFALYVMGYTAGRFWIEMLRIDDTLEQPGAVQETVTTVLGQRLNVWVSVLVFAGALAYFLRAFPPARGEPEFVLPVVKVVPAEGDTVDLAPTGDYLWGTERDAAAYPMARAVFRGRASEEDDTEVGVGTTWPTSLADLHTLLADGDTADGDTTDGDVAAADVAAADAAPGDAVDGDSAEGDAAAEASAAGYPADSANDKA